MTEPGIGGQPIDATADEIRSMPLGARIEYAAAYMRQRRSTILSGHELRITENHTAAVRTAMHDITDGDPKALEEIGRALVTCSDFFAPILAGLQHEQDHHGVQVPWRAVASLIVNSVGLAGVDLMDGK